MTSSCVRRRPMKLRMSICRIDHFEFLDFGVAKSGPELGRWSRHIHPLARDLNLDPYGYSKFGFVD